jgi:hypothetical protein
MQSASLKNLVLFGLLTPIAGCYSYGYQSPYGPGPYGQPYQPVYPGGPGYTMPPGQPYIPGGTTPGGTSPGLGGPTPITPPGGNAPPTYDNTNGSNGPIKFDAPDFNPNPGSPPAGNPPAGGRGSVPDPNDDLNGSGGPAASKPELSPTSAQRDAFEADFPQETNNTGEAPPARISTEQDVFEVPDRIDEAEPAAIRKISLEVPANDRPNPYGRDRKHANPEWLRGLVNFDQRDRTWELIYSATPDGRDPNGGSLTLGHHPELSRCRSGDVVLIEGAIDSSQVDSRGKPIYAVDKVTPLKAR